MVNAVIDTNVVFAGLTNGDIASEFAHAVEALPAKQMIEQQARFHALLQSLGPAMNDAEWQAFLQQREGKPKQNVSKAVERRLRSKIVKKRKTAIS